MRTRVFFSFSLGRLSAALVRIRKITNVELCPPMALVDGARGLCRVREGGEVARLSR